MVELFTATGFADSRRSSRTSVPSVTRRQLPTPAALNALAEASPNPTDGILHALHETPALPADSFDREAIQN